MGECPDIDTCPIPVEKDEYEKQCKGDFGSCFANSAQLPSKWKEDENKNAKGTD